MTQGLQLINFNVPQTGEELQEKCPRISTSEVYLECQQVGSTAHPFAVVLWFFSSFVICSSFLPMETTVRGQEGRHRWTRLLDPTQSQDTFGCGCWSRNWEVLPVTEKEILSQSENNT